MTGPMTGPRYAVDLDELLATVAALGRCGEALDARLDEVAARVAALHDRWVGLAADAQAVAQAGWEAGFREMRAGLEAMRAAGETAHGSYSAAAATNVRMWEQLT